LDAQYHHLLVLELQGLENVVIKSTNSNKLQQFSEIIIRCAEKDLYQQRSDESVINLLQSQLQQANQDKEQQAKLDAEVQKQIEKLTKELNEAKQTVSLSVKLQMLKEGDLKDLQERYQVVLLTQKKQYELLTKLSQRLNVAAKYFNPIALEKNIKIIDKPKKEKKKKRTG